MSQNQRQASLFAAETFQNIYRSYKNVDFRAYDFYSLKNALIEYIKRNYPEDFNDYIESSEYIAVIELLAYLGTSISFRVDLNARENFIDTAERRESIVRLAQMINYQPKRNKPANGLLKIVGVETTESVYDSLGKNLSNTAIFWDDPNNPDCYDQYVTIMNSAFPTSSPFGKAVKKGVVGGISTDLYRINNVKNVQVAYPLSLPVNGQQYQCDVCNVDISSDSVFIERHPDPSSYFHIMYRNDGHGFSSVNTGFFVYFRQGRLNNYDFLYEFPEENTSEELTTKNINEDDVYVQSIDNNGNVLTQWSKVSYSRGNESIVYNDIDKNERDIYSVTSGVNDTITIQYSDGNFGNVPTGLIRVWARDSANTALVMRPDDINNVNLRIPYIGQDSQTYYLRVVLSLEETINNATVSESNEDIKIRAPQGYYTQDRMVNTKDYNMFPLTIGNEILKVNTINRTHSGHSRYIPINDPTGFHQSLYITASDGAFYKDSQTPTLVANYDSETDDPRSFVIATIQNHIKNDELSNFFYDDYIEQYRQYKSKNASVTSEYNKVNVFAVVQSVSWNTITNTDVDNVGYIATVDPTTNEHIKRIIEPSFSEREHGYDKFIEIGSVLKFASDRTSKKYLSATVLSMEDAYDIHGDKFTKLFFNVNIPNGWLMIEEYPAFRTTFTDQEINAIVAELTNTSNFSMMYIIDDTMTTNMSLGWNVIELSTSDKFLFSDETTLWMVNAFYSSTLNEQQYTFKTRGSRYIFESESDVRFYVDQDQQKKYASDLVIAKLDEIVISETNPQTKNKTEEWMLTDIDGSEMWVYSADKSIVYDKNFVNLGSRNYTEENVIAYVVVPDGASSVTCVIKNGIITFVGNPTIGCVLHVELRGNSERLEKNYSLNIVKSFYENSGYLNTAKVEVIPADLNNDGIPDDPYIFNELIDKNDIVFFENAIDENGFSVNRLWTCNWYDLRGIGIRNMDWTSYSTTDLFLILDKDRDNFQYEMNYAMLYDLLVSESYASDKGAMETIISDYVSYLFNQVEDEFGGFMSGTFEVITGNINGFNAIVNDVVDGYRTPTAYTVMENPDEDNTFTLQLDIAIDDDLTNSVVRLNENIITDGVTIVYDTSTNIVTVTLDEEIYADFLDAENVTVDIAIRLSPENVASNYLNGIGSYSMFTYSSDNTHYSARGRSYTQNVKAVHQYPFDYKWRHFSTDDNRIDPSVSNIMDMIVLTNSYYDMMKKWKRERKSIYELPVPPTTEELRSNFSSLTKYKMMTDEIIFKSCSFKILFGQQAPLELRAKFKVIKVPNSLMTDNEIKTKVVDLIDKYFEVSEWNMGETFYFTELAAYIHKEMAGVIGTIILVPEYPESWFGSLFEVKVGQNELLMSTAQVSDIIIVDSLTQNNMRA